LRDLNKVNMQLTNMNAGLSMIIVLGQPNTLMEE
jgi:hypothetical protein